MKNPHLRRAAVPLLFLLITWLAYGWQIKDLGFYWDDWAFVYRYQTLGIFRTIYYASARHLGAYALMPGFLLAGSSPLLWHIYSIFLRWLVSLLAWQAFKALLRPQQTLLATLSAALFAVHPAFSQQAIAVIYSLQFVTYGLFLLSFWAMLQAQNRRSWAWAILALLSQAAHLFIVEYYVGLELIRPLALFLILSHLPLLQRIKNSLWAWLPHLGIFLAYALWRSGIFGGEFVDYGYKTITALWQADPRAALLETLEYGVKDSLVLLVQSWANTLSPQAIDFSQPYHLFSLLIAVLAAAGLAWAFSRLHPAPQGEENPLPAFWFGLFAALVGFIPAWFVRRHIVEPGNFGDRFALASLLGASLLLAALLQYFARRRSILLTAIFIGLAVGAQMRYANFYRWDWERQLRTYWQIYWRAPALQDGTVLLGYNAISTTAINYVGGVAINNLYTIPAQATAPRVWYANYAKVPIAENLDAFRAGEWSYTDRFAGYQNLITAQNVIGVDYDTPGRCLRLLTPNDPSLADLPEGFAPVKDFSNPALIQPQNALLPPAHIFGQEPELGWCETFQRASLARQQGDWQGALDLFGQAQEAGLQPLHPDELFPFIQAHAMLGNWQEAQALSLQSYAQMHKVRPSLCALWGQILFASSQPEAAREAYQALNQQISCP